MKPQVSHLSFLYLTYRLLSPYVLSLYFLFSQEEHRKENNPVDLVFCGFLPQFIHSPLVFGMEAYGIFT